MHTETLAQTIHKFFIATTSYAYSRPHSWEGGPINIAPAIKTCVLVLLIMIAPTTILGLSQASQLNLAVASNKPSYTYRDVVEITGNLTLNGSPSNGLVAIEVDDPNNHPVMVRTISVGTVPNGTAEILSVTPCDEKGNPKNILMKNEHAHVNVTVKNKDTSPLSILIIVCAYDSDSTPISPEVMILQTTILPQATVQFKPDIYIEKWVSTGPAKFYANVYSTWPKNAGIPYCSEKSATFNILSNYSRTTTVQPAGSYNLSFRLPPNAAVGTYTINASAYYQEHTSFGTATFRREFQMLGDINFDHVINILDIVSMTLCYGSKSGDSNWKPNLDINPDGQIDISDIVLATAKYGTVYESRTSTLSNPLDIINNHKLQSATTTTKKTNLTEYTLSTGVDAYTQYPDDYNGKGPNTPSDMFWPQKEVRLYAYAAYNYWPEQNNDVAFQISDPHGTITGIFYNRTDQNGITFIKFYLPLENLEYNFGEWTAQVTADIAGSVYRDTLTFKYDYRARLWCDKTSTDKPSYKHEEMIQVTIEYGTQSMQTFNAFFTITALDETGVPFADEWMENLIGGAQYCTYANGTLILNLYIPKYARAGVAKLQINILQNLPDGEPLCTECTITAQIEAG